MKIFSLKYHHLLLILLTACKTSEKVTQAPQNYIPNVDFSGQLDPEGLSFIRENYPWTPGSVLVINFLQPRSQCHFDNYAGSFKDEKKWWGGFYEKVNAENYTNIFVYSQGELVKFLDDKVYFDDKDDFLWWNYFGRKKSCFGVLVLNEAGYFHQYNGHYSERQVAAFIEDLKG